jgi:hypothetical protein
MGYRDTHISGNPEIYKSIGVIYVLSENVAITPPKEKD